MVTKPEKDYYYCRLRIFLSKQDFFLKSNEQTNKRTKEKQHNGRNPRTWEILNDDIYEYALLYIAKCCATLNALSGREARKVLSTTEQK